MEIRKAKILYFVNGEVPTAEHYAEAFSFNGDICFRNSAYIDPNDPLERCDGVAGDVPENYLAAFPKAEQAVAEKEAALAEIKGASNEKTKIVVEKTHPWKKASE